MMKSPLKKSLALSLLIALTFCPGMYILSAQVWTQVGSDIDEEGNSISLSASGTCMAIGTDLAFSNSGTGGRVRVYSESAGVWSQLGGDNSTFMRLNTPRSGEKTSLFHTLFKQLGDCKRYLSS